MPLIDGLVVTVKTITFDRLRIRREIDPKLPFFLFSRTISLVVRYLETVKYYVQTDIIWIKCAPLRMDIFLWLQRRSFAVRPRTRWCGGGSQIEKAASIHVGVL